MTSPARGGPDTAGMRSELAEALREHGYWSSRWMPERDGAEGLAAALLPAVQRLAAKEAAEELEFAAEMLGRGATAETLLARAAALAAAAQPTDGRAGK